MSLQKSFWTILTGLDEEILLKTGEEVELKVLEEEKPKKEKKDKELFKSKDDSLGRFDENWLAEESHGQLALDLYEQGENLIIESTIAGVKPENIDITVEQDLITIRGERKREETVSIKNYFYQECFWGKFSRTLVLPSPVDPERVRAEIKNGILKIVLPKSSEERAASLKPK